MAGPAPFIRFAQYGALAFEFLGAIAAGAAVGWYLDRWLGTDPYGAMVLTLLGVVGGFLRFVEVLRRFDRMGRGGES